MNEKKNEVKETFFSLAKRREIESEITITIHNKRSLDPQWFSQLFSFCYNFRFIHVILNLY